MNLESEFKFQNILYCILLQSNYTVKAHKQKLGCKCMLSMYDFSPVDTCKDEEVSCKIFNTDLRAIAVNTIHWHIPGLRSFVAVMSSPSFRTDLLGCLSHNWTRNNCKIKNNTIILGIQSDRSKSLTTNQFMSWWLFGGSGTLGWSTYSGRS